MVSESQLKDHAWWHKLFSKWIGTYMVQYYNKETGESVNFARSVFYCSNCKKDFYEGEDLDKSFPNILTTRPILISYPRPDWDGDITVWPLEK